MFSNFAWSEMLVIAVVAILVVGPKDLPGMLRSIGKTVGNVKRMAGDFQRQFNDAIKEADMDDIKEMTSTKGFAPLEDAKRSMEEFARSLEAPADSAPEVEAPAVEQPVAEAKPAGSEEPATPAARKPATKKAAPGKPAAQKAAAKKPAAAKSAPKKAAAKKAAPKKAAASASTTGGKVEEKAAS